jgi:sarcosine oxidase subunit alpha
MTEQPNRLTSGGFIDRTKPLQFRFDGQSYSGYQGDTLASALLANGVVLVGRSFKYHRPRGVFSAGVEEPNALVHLREAERGEPNTRATVVELYQGLVAESQNRGGSLRSDPQRINDAFRNFMPAGFYYKTFMGPFRSTRLWMWFENKIRKAAGMGAASNLPDPDHYDHMNRHCEVLVIGGGPSGLAAAKAAADSGSRVILVDERPALGGQLRRDRYEIDGRPGMVWVDGTVAKLEAVDKVTLLTRTTAFGYYDHNRIGCVQRISDHLPVPTPYQPRQRMWNIHADQVVLATGAHEQPMVFGNNDRPNIMLASAARAYINEYGVLPGKNAVVFTSCDDAYRTAIDLLDAGATVAAVVDSRDSESAYAEPLRNRGVRLLQGHAVVDARGDLDGVKAVEVMPLAGGDSIGIECDLVAMSNGWAPALNLFSQAGGKTAWDAERNVFVPDASKQAERSAGAARGSSTLEACLTEGLAAGVEAASRAGFSCEPPATPVTAPLRETPCQPLWEAPDPPSRQPKKFVDHQDDVAVSDVRLAQREGYESVEHLKRYTTLGMGTEQGKTSNIAGLAIMAAARGCSIPEAGHTSFRPPYTPVALGALAGAEVGAHFAPLRRTPMDSWHAERGSEWVDAGLWRRPRYYPMAGETLFEAYVRETKGTRNSVGLCDVSSLGKIDVQGPDAAEFLERVYVNHWKKLPVGKARYGVMLREDGLVYDDGTTSRLGENHFLMTTTTASAVKVIASLEFYLQAVWPDLRVRVASVTEQWAAMSVAGPSSRQVLQQVVELDISNAALPFMGVAECVAAGIPKCRLFRISFSGEMAFELNVPSDYGRHAWECIMEAGKPFGIVPYGTEALGNMRIEKGHVAGSEIDGRASADDLGLGRMLSEKKEFIGKRLARRDCLRAAGRKSLVGFVPVDRHTRLKQGSQITIEPDSKAPVQMIGRVSSTGYSPELGYPIALGFIEGGLGRWEGKTVHMRYPLRDLTVPVLVVPPAFIDPEGERLRG